MTDAVRLSGDPVHDVLSRKEKAFVHDVLSREEKAFVHDVLSREEKAFVHAMPFGKRRPNEAMWSPRERWIPSCGLGR